MKRTLKGIVVLVLVAALSFFASDQTQALSPAAQRLLATYTTTTVRTNNVNKYCPANLDRTTLVSASDVSSAQSMRATLNSQFGFDGNVLIRNVVNNNADASVTMIKNSVAPMAIFIGVFAIVLILILLLCPYLFCCCTCPYCCPSKCCQKAEDEQYSKCELYWPTTILVLSLLLIISASIYGFVKVSTFGPSIRNFGCATAIFVDDVLNGNVTTSGSTTTFFTGLNTLSTQLNSLNSNLATIDSSFSDLATTGGGSSTDTARTDVNNRLTDIKQIPDSGTFTLSLNYNSPIDANPTSTTTTSTFVQALGDFNTANSLVGGLYTVVKGIYDTIDGAKNSAAGFRAKFSQVGGAITSIQTQISSITDSITKVDNNLGGALGGANSAGEKGNMGLQAFYGVFIGFGFLALLGTLLTVCCDKYGCRHLIYFSCAIMFLVGVVGALLSTLFSVFLPFMTWGCSFLEVTLTQSGFTTNLGTPLGTSVANQLLPCIPGGDGNIINSIATGDSQAALNNLTTVITTMGSFNNAQLQGWISGNLTTFVNTVASWCKGEIPDLDTTNINILSNLATPTSSSWTSCNAAFSSDSWIPSNNPNTSISSVFTCKVTSANKGDTTTCTATLGNNGANTCGGCMDSTKLQTIVNPGSTLKTNLDTRYGASCSFNTPMSNVWNNYYGPKNTKLGPTATTAGTATVLERTYKARDNILSTTAGGVSGGVFAALNTMESIFNTIKTNLNSIQSLTDPNYGLLAGLNCKLFGEDFVQIQNILCGSMYYNLYTMRLAFGIIAWGVMFMMCCAVCTGVRHYKHSLRKEKIGDAFFKNSFDEASGEAFKRKE